MAIEMPMTEDIRKYDTKVIGSLNKRQMICTIIAAVVAIPAVAIPNDIVLKVFFVILFAVPIMLCGWISYYGMHLEVLIGRFFYLYILTPRIRKNISINTYRQLDKELAMQEEKEKINSLTSKERKEYYKNKKHTKIIYGNSPESKIYR